MQKIYNEQNISILNQRQAQQNEYRRKDKNRIVYSCTPPFTVTSSYGIYDYIAC